MRPSAVLLAFFAALPVFAGCLGTDDAAEEPEPPAPFVFVDPMSTDNATHDHTAPSHHAHELNASLVAHLPLIDDDGQSAVAHSLDLCDRWLVVSREDPATYGVDIVDVSDPAAPQWVGRYRDANDDPADRDVAWSADRNYIFHANDGLAAETAGLRVIHAVDKTTPVFESFFPLPGFVSPAGTPIGSPNLSPGFHTVFALEIGTVQYVYGLSFGVYIFRAAPNAEGEMTLTLLGRYFGGDPEQILAVNQADGPNLTSTRRAFYGHDMGVYIEGSSTTLYLANAYDGFRIADITVPEAPRTLGHWVPGGPGAPHYVHSARAYTREDGRRITVVGSETFEDRNTEVPSPIWVLDTSDPANIQHLSTWVNPGGHPSRNLFHSAHFYEIENDALALAHYHGGLWLLNLTDPAQPTVSGYYMPHEDTGYIPSPACCFGYPLQGQPMTMDVRLRDGLVYAADAATGLYVVRPA